MNGTKAYRAAYPGCKSDEVARAAAARLLANVSIRARVEEILAAGAERAEITVEQVLRELAVLGFSDIGKVVRWRPELVYEELEDADNPDQPARQVLQSRVLVIDSATLPPEARLAVAEVSQWAAGLDRQAPRHVRRPRADTRAQSEYRNVLLRADRHALWLAGLVKLAAPVTSSPETERTGTLTALEKAA
jgi:phage terminase small subunit